MRERYVRAITDEGFNPAGYPQIEPVVNEAGKDFEFVATMEVYPDVERASRLNKFTQTRDTSFDVSLQQRGVREIRRVSRALIPLEILARVQP